MRVLLTGGSGFLGAWILRRLLAGGMTCRILDLRPDPRLAREVAGIGADDPRVEWRAGDVRDAAAMQQAAEGCGGLIHLVGLLTPACAANPVLGAEVNLIGSLHAFLAAQAAGIGRVVYASSAAVFGPRDGHTPCPTTQYGATKLAVEGAARAFWRDAGIASTGFRPYVVYGPGREGGLTAAPSLACRAAARGEPYVIPYTGASGMVFAEDVSAAFVAALRSGRPGAEVFNLNGETADTDALIAAIRRVVPGAELRAEGPPLPFPAALAPDGLDAALPGLPRTTLAEGLARTIAHERETAPPRRAREDA